MKELLATIIENQDEDAPRLIYADWLEEQGEETRAEFIRVQCKLAETRKEPGWVPDPDDYSRIYGQQLEMLFRINNHDRESRIEALKYRQRQLFDIGTNPGGFLERPAHWGELTWARGFIEATRLPMKDWLQFGPTICAENPVKVVTISDRSPYRSESSPNHWRWLANVLSHPDGNPAYIGDVFWFIEDSGLRPFNVLNGDTDTTGWYFDCPEFARLALGRACLNWARSANAQPALRIASAALRKSSAT